MPIGSRRFLLPAALVLMAALLVWVTWRESVHAEQQVRRLMVAQAESLAGVIGQSAEHGLAAYSRWEDEVAARLLDNARWVAGQDSVSSLTSVELRQMASRNRLHRINLFDASGRRTATSSPDSGHDLPPKHAPGESIGPILNGSATSLRIGFKEARFLPGSRYAVAVAREGGGAVVVNVVADSLKAALETVQPGHLFRALGRAHGVEYLAIQDRDGILAASTGLTSLSSLTEDVGLSGLLAGDSLVVREIASPLGDVFEVARVVAFPGVSESVLRIGLDPTTLVEVRGDLRRRAAIRLTVFLVSAAMAVGLLLAWQRHNVLDHEIRRVRIELEAKSEEKRRADKLAAMGALAAGVAHEIRNPLNTIHMIAQRLGRTSATGEVLQVQIAHVRNESERIEKIIRQFLDFSRPRSPSLERLDAGEVVTATAEAQRAAFAAAGVELEVDVQSVEATLDGDMIASITDNLLRNAREASPSGGAVTATLRREGSEIVLTVCDEGAGVPADVRDQVFDVYFTTKPAGTGLGLSLVAQMAASMGGRVSLAPQTSTDAGACFVVRLPREGRLR
ncbi:HAMP domain-containing histidine kinase [bacterium]|nr:HAMP domain-containing histidine kinase [bacterium]